LSVLGTAFRLGLERLKVVRLPIIHLLKEATPRQEFIEQADLRVIVARLPIDLQVAVTIIYTYGWRLGEAWAGGSREWILRRSPYAWNRARRGMAKAVPLSHA